MAFSIEKMFFAGYIYESIIINKVLIQTISQTKVINSDLMPEDYQISLLYIWQSHYHNSEHIL
ncbi:hypothetical protein BBD42_11080 [Paenibacillus sp. BIHB 4019]|uniref:Uncharacterized protein n=1 Tax=Paenibacillus sp. BIHB 4019 TaxID=1870819 RepID=A0A1B2DGW3_9BACL|nr:hypothetical protein BBD42_11080 [Paenibacillus sp. BIHB 4019]